MIGAFRSYGIAYVDPKAPTIVASRHADL